MFAGGMALRNYLINTDVRLNIIITFYYDNACFNAVLNEYLWAEKKKSTYQYRIRTTTLSV